MAGAGKKRQVRERRDKGGSSDDKSKSPDISESVSNLNISSPPTAVDGNRDPSAPRSRASSTGSQGSQGQASGQASSQGQTQVAVVRAPTIGNRNIDAGAIAAFRLAGLTVPELPAKPPPNKTGREVSVTLNAFPVANIPNVAIYQYDILIGNGDEPPAVNKLIWESKIVREKLFSNNNKSIKWIYDGKKLAWTNVGPPNQMKIDVDLDVARGNQPKSDGKPFVKRLVVNRTKQLDFAPLEAYLHGKADWSDAAYEALNFLDHLMREKPSKQYIKLKRSFFSAEQRRINLGGGIEAFKGVYASVRPVNQGFGKPGVLAVNVDVANSAFWIEGPLHLAAAAVSNVPDVKNLAAALKAGTPDNDENNNYFKTLSQCFNKKIKVTYKHLKDNRPRTVEKVLNQTAKAFTFQHVDEKTGKETKVSINDYFFKQYKIRLVFPDLPVVKMTGGEAVLPMEQCYVIPNQHYGGKLNDRQTSEMIKFAVTPPNQRWQSIQNGLNLLDWANDENLKEYGMKITTTPTTAKARVLANPKVMFGAQSQQNPVDPRTSGRWDMRGKVFIEPHKDTINHWGICIITRGNFRISKDQVKNFIKTFGTVYRGHGGKIGRTDPVILECADPKAAVEQLFNAVGSSGQHDPQLLMFVVPSKEIPVYNLIKRIADCRYGVASQVLLASHVEKAAPQYCSNVSMKVNAKLGGWTSQAVGVKGQIGWFGRPTMVIGGDVSHGAPGTDTASVAAITMSWDVKAIKYIAGVETNGVRTEIIQDENFDKILKPMVKNWMVQISGRKFPEHIIYVRDGVSEGQYPQVLANEVTAIRRVLRDLDANAASKTRLTVVIVTKRHHIRFFPPEGQGDRNNNPLPGTLVETGVTSPFTFDFYLCAHAAIKGTARPAHYQVLLDEANMKPEELQQWIYESSYQYVRATTPVSLFPAVYYADLAAGRAVCHDPDYDPYKVPKKDTGTNKSGEKKVAKPLLPMPPRLGIRTNMWFV